MSCAFAAACISAWSGAISARAVVRPSVAADANAVIAKRSDKKMNEGFHAAVIE